MSILVTNDDGFEAIGIQALLASTKTLDPIMVAPKYNCSGMSAAISLRKEVNVKQLNLKEQQNCAQLMTNFILTQHQRFIVKLERLIFQY